MYSRWDIGIVLLMFSYLVTFNVSAQQKTTEIKMIPLLLAMPAKCVTLTQGRQCFATVTLNWQAPIIGNYCIYQVGTNKALDCWYNQQKNTITFEFESNKSVQYKLVENSSELVIADARIEVSWVHKASPRKRRWRLF